MSEEVGRGILGEVTAIDQVVESGWTRRKSRHIIFLMSASVSLLMTGFGIIMPIFGRKLAEMGLGVESLGMMIMAFSIAQFVAAPLMGKMADRYGRRRLVLLALFSFGVANLAFLLADSLVLFVAIRAVQGFFTAGLLPACIGIIGDLDSGDGRAKKIGWLVAGHSVGFVFGPFLGGLWYDLWGFEIPFLISAALGFISLVFTYFMIPETLGLQIERLKGEPGFPVKNLSPTIKNTVTKHLPKPMTLFTLLLFLEFICLFSLAYVEPQMVFYFYGELGWSTMMFGLAVGTFGLSQAFFQVYLGGISDSMGRKPVIILGVLLFSLLYLSLVVTDSFLLILVACVFSGLGQALFKPALSALVLDITPKKNLSGIMGIQESARSLGGIIGPGLVTLIGRTVSSQFIFTSACLIVVGSAFLALIVLKEPKERNKGENISSLEMEIDRKLIAQNCLQNLSDAAKRIRSAKPL